MKNKANKNKYLILFSSILTELVLGTVYAYSVVRVELEHYLGLNSTLSSIPYLLSLSVFALLVMLSGKYLKSNNYYKWIFAGIFAIFAGYIISAISNNYILFTIGYGIFIGSGVGILYGIPIQIVQKTFTKNKGLAIGISVAGFGLSTIIAAPLLQQLFNTMSFTSSLLYFGMGSVVILIFALFLLHYKIDLVDIEENVIKDKVKIDKRLFTIIFIIFTFGIVFGLSMIGLTGYIGVNYYNLGMERVSVLMTVFALSNGLSRPLFGLIYDRFKIKVSVILVSSISLMVSLFYVFTNINSEIYFIITLIFGWGTTGAWLALMPLITKDLFSKNNFKRTFGNMYLSYGLAAIVGNLYTSLMIDNQMNLNLVFIPVAILSSLTIVTILFINHLNESIKM